MKIDKIVIGIIFSFLVISCEDWKYDGNIEPPSVSINIENPTTEPGDTVIININSDAQYLAYYSGDSTHRFEKSRVYALWQQGIDAFYDSTYKVPVTENVTEWEWKFSAYNSMAEIEAAGFSFHNCSAELGQFEQPATAYMKVNNKKQLHLKVTRNDQASQIILTPHDMFVAENQFGIMDQTLYMELYFVSDEVDAALRETSGILGQSELKVTYVMKDGKRFSHDDRGRTKDDININFITKNPLLYPGGGGEFPADRNLFRGMVDEQIDSLIIQFGSGEGVVAGDTTKYYGFSGDVFIVSMKLGDTHFYEWEEGVNLYSNYVGPQNQEHQLKLVYDEPGTYNFWVVGTNVGRKIYTDENNYSNQYGFSSKDYDIQRTYEMSPIIISMK